MLVEHMNLEGGSDHSRPKEPLCRIQKLLPRASFPQEAHGKYLEHRPARKESTGTYSFRNQPVARGPGTPAGRTAAPTSAVSPGQQPLHGRTQDGARTLAGSGAGRAGSASVFSPGTGAHSPGSKECERGEARHGPWPGGRRVPGVWGGSRCREQRGCSSRVIGHSLWGRKAQAVALEGAAASEAARGALSAPGGAVLWDPAPGPPRSSQALLPCAYPL